jgi:hypothetical protein
MDADLASSRAALEEAQRRTESVLQDGPARPLPSIATTRHARILVPMRSPAGLSPRAVLRHW